MRELLQNLDRWNLHPEHTVSHRFPLEQADEAYRTADSGTAGKVAIVPGAAGRAEERRS